MSVVTRLDIEAAEHLTLCDRAAFSDLTRGRERAMELVNAQRQHARVRERGADEARVRGDPSRAGITRGEGGKGARP